MAKIGMIGAGSWGSALSWLLANNGHEVIVWSALADEIAMLSECREQKSKLPGVILPESVTFTTDLKEAVEGRDLLVLAVPSPFTRSTARQMKDFVGKGQIVVNVAKGIEEGTLMTLSQIIEEEIPQADVAVLSGPSHAEEVGKGLPTTIVAGARTKSTAELVQNIFMSPVFRVYTSPDVLGIELGAALKNVVALAAGILGTAMGGRFETFCGLSGIGDLIVTCASMHSRNRRAGILIGKGYTMEEAMKEVKMVVEGVYSAKAAMGLASKYGVQLPIIEQVNEVLFQGKPAAEAVRDLMLRDKKIEISDTEWS